MDKIKTLGDYTQGKVSFLEIPDWMIKIFARVRNEIRPEVYPEEKVDSAVMIFREKCLEWARYLSIIPKWPQINELLSDFKLRVVFHPLTVCEIEVDSVLNPPHLFGLTQEKVVYRWEGFFYAFTVFWAFIYHTSNEHLENPETIWQKILEHISSREFGSSLAIHLSLYERLVAILYCDIARKMPHYWYNIVSREGLKVSEQMKRPDLFARAIEYLLNERVVPELVRQYKEEDDQGQEEE